MKNFRKPTPARPDVRAARPASAGCVIEQLEGRQLMTAAGPPFSTVLPTAPEPPTVTIAHPPRHTISGHVFNDADGDGVRDHGERGRRLQAVFLDANDNAARDSDERLVRTNASGRYAFRRVPTGTYTPRLTDLLLTAGARVTVTPQGPIDTLFGPRHQRGLDFGITGLPYPADAPDAHVHGVVFRDANGNNKPDPGEGVARRVTLAQVNGDASYTLQTDAGGQYDLPAVRPGTYTVQDSLVEGGGYSTLILVFMNVPPGEDAVRDIRAQSYPASTFGSSLITAAADRPAATALGSRPAS